MAKRIRQCAIEFPTSKWVETSKKWNDACTSLTYSVEQMILSIYKEMCKNGDDDFGFMDISNENVKLYESDGELQYSYEAKYIDVEEDDTIVIISEDDYGNEDSKELCELTYEQIYNLGAAFYHNYEHIAKTSKDFRKLMKWE